MDCDDSTRYESSDPADFSADDFTDDSTDSLEYDDDSSTEDTTDATELRLKP